MWGRDRPGCLIVLIDQSGSMSEQFEAGSDARSKAEISATVVNRALQDLIREATSKSAILDRFEVAVLGYGGDGVRSAFGGTLTGVRLAAASELSANPLRVEQRETETLTQAGDLVQRRVQFRVWLDPVADGPTPMCAALDTAYELASGWAENHLGSFPPIVLNVTDGLPTDGGADLAGLFAAARRLGEVETRDGRLLCWNCHITVDGKPRVLWPNAADLVPHGLYESALFETSSEIPETLRDVFYVTTNQRLGTGTRGYVLNADQVALSKFLTFGSRVGMAPRVDLALSPGSASDQPAGERYSGR